MHCFSVNEKWNHELSEKWSASCCFIRHDAYQGNWLDCQSLMALMYHFRLVFYQKDNKRMRVLQYMSVCLGFVRNSTEEAWALSVTLQGLWCTRA